MQYGDYLHLDEVLGAQRPLSGDHNEMLFIVQHQAMELWMRLGVQRENIWMADSRGIVVEGDGEAVIGPVDELVVASYRLVAPPELVAQLDAWLVAFIWPFTRILGSRSCARK